MAPKLGEYVLEKPIGRGAMGQVWLARQESLDRMVAVKVLPKQLARDQSFLARFEREAKTAASMVHPNVIQVYSFGIERNVPYFAMEFVQGEDLSVKLRKGQNFSIKDATRITADVARALECAHEKGMVHRDIKPGNIMIAKNGTVKVMDFGLAKAASVKSFITQPGLIMGTPAYMSPEQGMGQELDVRSDMYSLGVVLYKLLTGQVPFNADTPTAVIFMHIYEPPPSIKELNPDVPDELVRITNKLMEKKPDARYPDPTALIADLEAFLSGATPTASAARPVKQVPGGASRTEAIASQTQPPMGTQTMDAREHHAAEVTEPIVKSRPESTTLPTQAAAGYVKTKDEGIEFLEDLMQGEDPGAYARAADIFEKNPGLRDSYARQQYVHALLRSQVDVRDRVSRNKRITRVLSVVGRDAPSASPVAVVKSGASLVPRSRNPMIYVIIAAAIFLAIGAVGLTMMMPSFQESAAIMELVRQKSAEGADLTYQVTLVAYAPTREELRGTIHLKGSDKWVLNLEYGQYIKGSDGHQTWIIQPGNYVYVIEQGKEMPPIVPIAMEIPAMSLNELLTRRTEYNMKMLGDASLESHPDRKLVHIRCTALPGKTESPIQQATYWIDKEAGIIIHAEMELLSGPSRTGHREIILDYTGEESCNVRYYHYDYHKGGRNLYADDSEKGSWPDKPPWERFGPGGDGTAPK
jgi:serine/threonine protein kinase